MKKIMIMLLMAVMASFASPLFAFSGSPPFVGSYSTNAGEMVYSKAHLGQVGSAHAEDVGRVKVYIHHKDTMMYSWGEGIDNKTIPGYSGCYKQNANMNRYGRAVAVVCYPRGSIEA